MKKGLICISFIWTSVLFSQEYQGCGEYLFKGILKDDKESPYKMNYVVNSKTKSEMIFEFSNESDLASLAILLDTPSSFKGKITKRMNGTKGVVKSPNEISKRFPDPLKSMDTGIFQIKAEKCD
jgi:hypothetical protein